MNRKLINMFFLAILLTGMLNLTQLIHPTQAATSSNIGTNEEISGTSGSLLRTLESTNEENITKDGDQDFQGWEDRWDFQNLSEWSNFVYTGGEKTRLVVGLRYNDVSNLTKLEELAAKHQAEILKTITFGSEAQAIIAELPLISVARFVEDVNNENLAEYIEPDIKAQAHLIPNDPYWSTQWGPQKIEADWAWNTTVGNSTVIIAIIDTGIDYTHPDLTNYVSLGYDWVNNDSDPMDDYGHGTHCAGIAAATLNNSIGISGLAQVQIMAEKVLNNWGQGYTGWIADGIIHAVDSGADIISMSLGAYADSELIHDAVRYAYNAGVLIAASAGNDNTNVHAYPASYDEVIAVSATDSGDHKAYFSNWGDWIELSAPGVSVYSTVPWGYEYASGTSMACPHVAGVAALGLCQFPTKSMEWLRHWIRYTCDDLGSSGFDEYYGYGRINARATVENHPPTHELIACRWETPPYFQTGTMGVFNTTILNFGETEETNITVQLIANNTIVDSTLVETLSSGASTRVILNWNATIEGLYNVTLFMPPVLNETSEEDNILFKFLFVGFPVKALVLHSAGNYIDEIITNWQVLNNEWHRFGDQMVYIDYTTLNKEEITYEDIVASEADVLIISCAFDKNLGWEFTDSEIEAIEHYTLEGHGLIVTAGTFYYGAPNNNELASLFGLEENVVWVTAGTDLMHLVNASHQVFTDVPDPFVFSGITTATPSDGSWDSSELLEGEYIALGHYLESAIVEYRGLMYISPWLEIIPAYYHHHIQLLYNAISQSRYQKPAHELVVTLQCPQRINPGETAKVNASVSNMGINNETDVELLLFVDSELIANKTSITLEAGQTETLNYSLIPTIGKYNITAYSSPVPSEETISNNVRMRNLRVSYPATIGFIETHGENLHGDDLEYHYEGLGHNVTTITSNITQQLLEDFDMLVVGEDWSDTTWTSEEIFAVHNFINLGKGLVCIGDELSTSVQNILSNYGLTYSGYNGVPGSSSNLYFSHPVMEQVSSIYASYPIDSLNVNLPGFWLAYDSINENVLIAGAEFGGYVICMSDDFAASVNNDDNDVMFTNIVDWMTIRFEHDLAISLDVPTWIELDSSTMINVTVRNAGLNNETNVNLQLLINSTLIRNETITQLETRQTHTINYTWTPTTPGKYNITAHTPPKPQEGKVANNIMTRIVYTFFYRKLSFPHEWHGGGVSMNWEADDGSWPYVLPFDFPFYGRFFRTIYISSNGLITFTGSDRSYSNSISALSQKLAIAPAWDDWLTYYPEGIFIWSNSSKVGIRWSVRAFRSSNIVGNFEAILSSNGNIQLNYEYSNGLVSATIGISNGEGHVIAEEIQNINMINSIIFTPLLPEHNLVVNLDAPSLLEPGNSSLLIARVNNLGSSNETNVNLQLLINSTLIRNETITQLETRQTHTINYTWTPTTPGKYNITAHTPPKPQEESESDNVVCTFTRVGYVEGYVLFDQTHGVDPIYTYSILVENLADQLYIVNTHSTGSLTSQVLEGCDVFIIPQALIRYSLTEISAIQDFVYDGGGLLVIGDDRLDFYTELTNFANITWIPDGYSGYTSDLTLHPVTEGVHMVYFDSPASLLVDSPAVGVVRDNYVHNIIAASEIGYGKVLAVADEHSINDRFINQSDNLILASNAITWLIAPRVEHEIITQLEATDLVISGDTIQLNASMVNVGLNNETAVELILLIEGEVKNSTVVPLLQSGSSQTITYSWTPVADGTYNVTAYTPPVPDEDKIENNIVTRLVSVETPEIPDLPSDRPVVYVDPQVVESPLGETFSVSVSIFNLTDAIIPNPDDPSSNVTIGNLYGFDIQLTWDSDVIQYLEHTVTVPVETYQKGILHEPVLEIKNVVNETEEPKAWFVYSSISPAPPFNGNGIVVHMTFRIVGEGTSELRLVTSDLATRFGESIFHAVQDGLVIVREVQEGHDVGIIQISHTPSFVYSGRPVNVTVTAINEGTFVETFNVTIYANSTNIGSQSVFDLPPRRNVTLTFTWNTTGLDPCNNFVLQADASGINGEIVVENNLLTGGVVRIKLLGDVDNNDVVDIFDVVLAVIAYGCSVGDPNYIADADLAPQYGLVDIFDLVTISVVFGSCA